MDSMITFMTPSFHLSWKTSNAYPAREHIKRLMIVRQAAFRNEFQSACPILVTSTNCLKLSKRAVPNIILPLETSTLLLVAEETIQNSGKTETKDAMIKNAYVSIFLNLFLVTLITYFHLKQCQDCHQYKHNVGNSSCISKLWRVQK